MRDGGVAGSVIAVATSIPPKLARRNAGRAVGDEYQNLCIRSWIDNGFRVLSVNDPEEIPDLSSRFPAVDFVPAVRNASAWTGRKNPYIADILSALMDAPEPVVGIINADLIFERSDIWKQQLPSLVHDSIVIGNRYDADSLLGGAFRHYPGGIDIFFFDRTLARQAIEHAMPFAIGVIWWDYWLPLLAAFNKRKILVVDRPGIVHLSHKQGNKAAVWREFGALFAAYAVGQSNTAPKKLPEIATAILPLCREITALNRKGLANTRQYDVRLAELMDLFSRQIRKNTHILKSDTEAQEGNGADSYLPSAYDPVLTTANVFRRFEARAAAGQAVLRSKRLLSEKRLADAEREIGATLAETPNDFDALLICGELALLHGQLETAHRMLAKAGEQRPFATRRLQLLASVLHAEGKRDETIECFRKILETDPGCQQAYTDIAIVLWEENRRDEAFTYVEQALQCWPDLRSAAQLHDRFSKEAGLPVRARQDESQPAQSKNPLRWLSRAIWRNIRRTRF